MDLGRIMAFTDGVMAVAITLLVLNLEVPDVPAGDLEDALVDLVPSLIAYLLAFGLVGRFWIVHHRLFETMRRFDAPLMTLNLAFLSMIALVPFATELWDSYTDEPLAAAVFGATMGLAALVHWLMTVHTSRRGYVQDPVRRAQRFGSPVTLGITLVFLLSVPVAFLSTTAASLLWFSTLVLRYPLLRLNPKGP
jgi:uncharacterized membrane protein